MTRRGGVLARGRLLITLAGAFATGPARGSGSGAIDKSLSAPLAVATLEGLDSRAPLPLTPQMAAHQKANMRSYLEAVQSALAALAKGDFEAVASSFAPMGYSDATRAMCTNMGKHAPGFADRAIAFHRSADEIVIAARSGHQSKVLEAMAQTLRACTECHARYHQTLVMPDGGPPPAQHATTHGQNLPGR